MKNLAKSINILVGQYKKLKQVPKSNEEGTNINEFSEIIKEVMDFI